MDVIIPIKLSQGSVQRASSASYYNSSGLLSYAGVNVGRVNYNPANLSESPELLLENAMQQAVTLMTEGFQNNYTTSGATIYPNASRAPDGTFTATFLSENATSGNHNMTTPLLLASNIPPRPSDNPCAFSIYAKAVITDNSDRHQFVVNTVGVPSGAQQVLFDLTAATATVVSPGTPVITAIITPINNGWYRCEVNNLTYAQNIVVGIFNGSESYTGDGHSGMLFWGSQFENGQRATSYLPSTQAFVARSTNLATYINNLGRVASVGPNVARINYTSDNLTLAPKLLLERATTNLLLDPTNFSTASWTKTSTTVTGSQPDPTGSPTGSGWKLSDASSAVLGVLSQTVTVPNDTSQYVFSVYVLKTTTATTFPAIGLTYSGSGNIDTGITFNTNTGAYVKPAGLANLDYVNVQSLTGYWRVSIGLANNAGGNTNLTVKVYPSVNTDGSGTWSATTTGDVTVSLPQLELGACETSYIGTSRVADTFTVGSPTRAADVSTKGLLFTNIPENDFPVWNSATTYGIDVAGSNSVIYNHVKYASLQASNINHQPDISPTWWSVIGATNAYAMFDSQVGTQTVGVVGGRIITYINIGALGSLSFLNVSADAISVQIFSNYTQVYNSVIDFTGGESGVPITDYTLTGFTTYPDAIVRLDIYSATSAPAIGNLVVGTNYFLGSTETSPTIGITDYSVKNVDAFGNPILTVRGYAKRMNTKQLLDDADVDTIARLMAQVRATPCVWNANTTFADRTSNKKTSLIVYGYYKDWEIDVAYSTKSYLTAQIEGLI